ncbi:hypothetical protein [Euzebya tangerina]|uniref:COG4315 family predicted lipoprotein n=1 Tax=Euzebya tangerina TaxID=591198 RepID=UPI000E3135EF|nr:hypothetical protein [Euzebya tangerina]
MSLSAASRTASTLKVAAASALLALALAACGSDTDAEDVGAATAVAQTAEDAAATDDSSPSGGEAIVTTASTDVGDILVDADGFTVYGFTEDSDGTPTCEDACLDAWPAVTVESAEVPEGLDAEVFSVVERTDGTFQLVAGEWPLYTFTGDLEPGDTNGQGSGDVWFAAAPDGSLIQDETAEAAPASDASYDY